MSKSMNDYNWEVLQQAMKPTTKMTRLPVTALHPFKDHPYKVQDNEEMDALMESIRGNGIMSPLIVRPMDGAENEYEVVSGHRRLHAAKKAGISEVPALIVALDHDAAAIAVVDSNLHRENILPSEKAFAYKMKMEAISHQGTSGQLGQKWSREEISDTDSGRQVQRYIRLTNLIPELLKLMDDGKMALSVGVELSYLREDLQQAVAEAVDYYDCTPSYSQAWHLHQYYKDGVLDKYLIFKTLSEEKANQREIIKVPVERLKNIVPESYTVKQIEDFLIKAAEYYHRNIIRQRNRDSR